VIGAALGINEYGTPVTEFTCTHCGHRVSVCPAIPLDELEERWGYGCLGETCASYDIARDVDMFFEPAVEAGWIRSGDA
jgi:predicted molibdopterin-dependent oxidoreductase YjgC